MALPVYIFALLVCDCWWNQAAQIAMLAWACVSICRSGSLPKHFHNAVPVASMEAGALDRPYAQGPDSGSFFGLVLEYNVVDDSV